MTCQDHNTLADALAQIGRNPALRESFLEAIRQTEQALARPDFSVRDEVTGPLVDALHRDVGVLRKKLAQGLVFDFHYRSKIARDLVMSPDPEPDHVWEPQTTKLLVHLAAGARNVVIGGAYSGDQAILVAARLAPGGGCLHAFEPNAEQLDMLRHNAAANGLTNIVFNGTGLWRDDATRLQLVGEDSFAHPEVVDDDAATTEDAFPTVSVSAYGAARGIETVDLIMLDIEGAELPALEGAARYLAQPAGRAPVVVFELHRHYVDWSDGLENTDIIRFMSRHGYEVFAVRDYNSNVPMGDEPIELVPLSATYLEGPPHGFNMLAVKDRAIVETGPFRICPGVSPKLLAHRDPALHHPLSAA